MTKSNTKRLKPVHPGAVLLNYIIGNGLNKNDTANDLNISEFALEAILQEKEPITADIALRLARFFGVNAEFWMDLEAQYDLEVEELRLGSDLKKVRIFRERSNNFGG